MEMAQRLGDFDKLKICRFYIQMALTIGMEHFSKDMEEIVVMTREGQEIGRFKDEAEVAKKLGLWQSNISACLNGRQYSAGGYIFMKSKDKILVKREDTES
jgi:hypothetical protein